MEAHGRVSTCTVVLDQGTSLHGLPSHGNDHWCCCSDVPDVLHVCLLPLARYLANRNAYTVGGEIFSNFSVPVGGAADGGPVGVAAVGGMAGRCGIWGMQG